MTILESVERQLAEYKNELLEYNELEDKYGKSKSAMTIINRFRKIMKAKIMDTSTSLSMMKQGYHFTTKGWIK